MTQKTPPRPLATHVAFFIVFTALFAGGVVMTFVAAPLFGLAGLAWSIALAITLAVGAAAAWELRCLLLARRSTHRRDRSRAI